jgi:hypothetical protein
MSVKNCGVALAEVAGRVGVSTSAVFKMIKRTGKKFDQAQEHTEEEVGGDCPSRKAPCTS